MTASKALLSSVLITALATFGVVGISAPAAAAETVVNVASATALSSAFANSGGLETIVMPSTAISSGTFNVSVPRSVTLDLAGRAVTLGSLTLASGVEFTIRDSVGTGVLNLGYADSYRPSIQTTGATLRVTGGTINALSSWTNAAIGGATGQSGGSVIISGGTVNALGAGSGGALAAGIGGGSHGAAGTILITGGNVSASSREGAGIGSGGGYSYESYSDFADPGSITITGGNVSAWLLTDSFTQGAAIGGGGRAEAPSISITGGNVWANATAGRDGPGIGSSAISTNPVSIAISGGSIEARASSGGAGIGTGARAVPGVIAISGASTQVNAYASPGAAAIGGGASSSASITISDGTVNAIAPSTQSPGNPSSTSTALIGSGPGSFYGKAGAVISITGGTVTATQSNFSGDGGAAIGNGWAASGGSITISGGTVSATGNSRGPAIGSPGSAGPGGVGDSTIVPTSVVISGGTVTASSRAGSTAAAIGGGPYSGSGVPVTISGGTVTATAGGSAAAVGAATGAPTGTVEVGVGASLTVLKAPGSTAGSLVDASSLTVGGILSVGTGAAVVTNTDRSSTVSPSGLITGAGSLTGDGSITNNGTITTAVVSVDVTVNNFMISFDGNGLAAETLAGVRVYGATLDAVGLTLPSVTTTDSGWSFEGWSATAAGPATVTTATILTSNATVYAVWAPHELVVDSDLTGLRAGDTLALATSGLDSAGDDLGTVTDRTVFTSPAATGLPGALVLVDGNELTFLKMGVYEVTATIGSVARTISVTVAPGPTVSLVVTITSPVPAIAGNNLGYTVHGIDVNGDTSGDYTQVATVGDGSLGGAGVIVPTVAGMESYPVTLSPGITGTLAIEVLPAAIASFTVSLPPLTITAGQTVAFTAEGFDAYGNSRGDVTSSLAIVSDRGAASGISGATITPTASGFHDFTYSIAGNTAVPTVDRSLLISAGALVTFELSASSSTAIAGDLITLTAVAEDAYGNSISVGGTTFSSTLAMATSNSQFQMIGAGVHTITANFGGYSDTVQVTVTPGAATKIILSPAGFVTAGDSRTFSAFSSDAYDNPIADITASTVFTALPGDTVSGATVTFRVAGARSVSGSYAAGTLLGLLPVTVDSGALDSIEVQASSGSLAAGQQATFTVAGYDEFGNAVAVPVFTISSDRAATVTGATALFTEAGLHTVTANGGGFTDTVSVLVGQGALQSLTLDLATTTVAGVPVGYTVYGFDAHNNRTTLAATISSSAPGDTFDAGAVTATTAGSRTVTAAYGGLTVTAPLTVTAATVDSLGIRPTTAGPLTAGGSTAFIAETFDRFGNLVGTVTAAYASSEAGDIVSGDSVTAETAGVRTITGTSGTLTGTSPLTVVADAAHPMTITVPTPIGATLVSGVVHARQGSTITIAVGGTDHFGNPISGLETGATITSDQPTDVIMGNAVTFPHASPHVITVTVGALSYSFLVEVQPAAAALAATGVDLSATVLAGILLLLLGGAALMNKAVFMRRFIRSSGNGIHTALTTT